MDYKPSRYVTLSKIGYNAPSQANWAYGIWKLDLIDTAQTYCMSYTLKENFGGDYRLKQKIKELTGRDIIEVKGVFPTQKITGIKDIGKMESEETIGIVLKFLQTEVDYNTDEPTY